MDIKEIEKICIGQFEANSTLFKTTVQDSINKYRKGTKTVTIKDKAGNPLAGVKVRVTLKNHEFKHGANIFMLDQFETAKENEEYRNLFSEYFNLATVPFYWKELEPEQGKPRYDKDSVNIYRRPSPDLCLEYCRKKGIETKIHCLFYDKFVPDWLPKNDFEKMRNLYEKRFAEIAERYGNGVMYEIEVINELLSMHSWVENSILSKRKDSLEWSFKLAEKYFPNDVLVINDGNYLAEIGRKTYWHPYYTLIDAALAKGTRIDKIGVQNHIYAGMNENLTLKKFVDDYNPIAILKGLEVLSEFGKPLEITEISIPTFGEGSIADDMQAEVLKYLYTLWFSCPNLESAVYWNTVDFTAYSSPDWDENKLKAGLFNRDLTPKKSAKMLKKLFEEEWHTEIELETDESGKISFDGFHGDYKICVLSHNDEVCLAKLHKNDKEVDVVCQS